MNIKKENRLDEPQKKELRDGLDFLVRSGYVHRYGDIAPMLGVTQAAISGWRIGRSFPTKKMLEKLRELVEQAKAEGFALVNQTNLFGDNTIGEHTETPPAPQLPPPPPVQSPDAAQLLTAFLLAINNSEEFDDETKCKITRVLLGAI